MLNSIFFSCNGIDWIIYYDQKFIWFIYFWRPKSSHLLRALVLCHPMQKGKKSEIRSLKGSHGGFYNNPFSQ